MHAGSVGIFCNRHTLLVQIWALPGLSHAGSCFTNEDLIWFTKLAEIWTTLHPTPADVEDFWMFDLRQKGVYNLVLSHYEVTLCSWQDFKTLKSKNYLLPHPLPPAPSCCPLSPPPPPPPSENKGAVCMAWCVSTGSWAQKRRRHRGHGETTKFWFSAARTRVWPSPTESSTILASCHLTTGELVVCFVVSFFFRVQGELSEVTSHLEQKCTVEQEPELSGWNRFCMGSEGSLPIFWSKTPLVLFQTPLVQAPIVLFQTPLVLFQTPLVLF